MGDREATVRRGMLSRRRFPVGSGAVGAVALLATCGGAQAISALTEF